MNTVKLLFVNNSNDSNNSNVVIFQKNEVSSFDQLAIAWRVIRNCGKGDCHPFLFPNSMEVSASDSYRNFSNKLGDVKHGQLFHVFKEGTEPELAHVGKAPNENEIHVRNDREIGSIDAQIYRDGKLLAVKTNVVPAQSAAFQFEPTIWIGVVSQVQEEDVLNSAILSQVDKSFNLNGIASADIVMTGGGPGSCSTPFHFELENIVYAE